MSPTVKKLFSALLAAVAATVISFLAQSVVPVAPEVLQPVLTALLVAAAHYVDALGSAAAAARKAAPTALVILFALGLAYQTTGCALFDSKLPSAEKCLPTPAALAAQVADILAVGGDTTTALEQLAITQGEQAVICAVKAFLGNRGASPSESPARARAHAYLTTKGVK